MVTRSDRVSSVEAREIAVRVSGSAVFQMRSPDLSARRPQTIMKTEAIPKGMELSKLVSKVLKPKDFRIWGCHSERALLVAELPQLIIESTITYLLTSLSTANAGRDRPPRPARA